MENILKKETERKVLERFYCPISLITKLDNEFKSLGVGKSEFYINLVNNYFKQKESIKKDYSV